MLFDPKWNGPSLAGFIGWLETKNPRERYKFDNCHGECLLGQYMTSIGIEWGETPKPLAGNWQNTNYYSLGMKLFGKSNWTVLSERPWTFGGALERAREFVTVD